MFLVQTGSFNKNGKEIFKSVGSADTFQETPQDDKTEKARKEMKSGKWSETARCRSLVERNFQALPLKRRPRESSKEEKKIQCYYK